MYRYDMREKKNIQKIMNFNSVFVQIYLLIGRRILYHEQYSKLKKKRKRKRNGAFLEEKKLKTKTLKISLRKHLNDPIQ